VPNRIAAGELGALAERAFADGGVVGSFLIDLSAVVGAVATQEDVFADEPAV
jgi:hypothetical protein